jgi:ABC-type amino acid transport system permease subunit
MSNSSDYYPAISDPLKYQKYTIYKKSANSDRQKLATDIRLGQKSITSECSTRLINKLLQLDLILRIYNILASMLTWLLLASYIVFPWTFNSLRRALNKTRKGVIETIQNLPLLWIIGLCFLLGAIGMS